MKRDFSVFFFFFCLFCSSSPLFRYVGLKILKIYLSDLEIITTLYQSTALATNRGTTFIMAPSQLDDNFL